MLMGLISIWNRNFLGYASQAIIPYDQRLARFPAYLQQLNMESNGKSVDLDGERVSVATGPIVWGEPGTNGQHAFFQLLHQGDGNRPNRFLTRRKTNACRLSPSRSPSGELPSSRRSANARTVSRRGRKKRERHGRQQGGGDQVSAAQGISGQPTIIDVPVCAADPRTLGRLIALYEHKVFVEAAIWNINPFDQWGVELGKELASRLAPRVAEAHSDLSALDSSTAGLIAHLRKLRS